MLDGGDPGTDGGVMVDSIGADDRVRASWIFVRFCETVEIVPPILRSFPQYVLPGELELLRRHIVGHGLTESIERQIFQLMCSLFTGDAFRSWIGRMPGGEVIAALLPGSIASTSAVIEGGLEVLHRRGLLDRSFFARLATEFPRRSREIERLERAWSGDVRGLAPALQARDCHVFLSHHPLDKQVVIRLARALEFAGVHVWLDCWDIRPGEDVEPAIRRAVSQADLVLCCVGARGLAIRQRCELDMAASANVRRLFVRLPGGSSVMLSEPDVPVYELTDQDDAGGALAGYILGAMGGGRPDHRSHGPFAEGSPYPGLQSFDVANARWFYGRERETASVLEALVQRRWLWLLGNSGSGKSSLARAGVAAWWPTWTDDPGAAIVLRPGQRPAEAFAQAVSGLPRAFGRPPPSLQEQRELRLCPDLLLELLHRVQDEGRARPILVVLDQSEEIFDELGELRTGAAQVLTALAAATEHPAFHVHVLATIRADFLPRLLRLGALPEACRSGVHFAVPHLTEELGEALRGPAGLAGGFIEPAVMDVLLSAVRARPESLPLVQATMEDLWRGSPDKILRRSQLGDGDVLARALTLRFAAMERAGSQPADAWEVVFANLTELGEDEAPRRRTAPLAALVPVMPVIESLVKHRLVVVHQHGLDGDGVVEVIHESVFAASAAWSAWIATNRERLRLRLEIERDAQRWTNGGRSDDLLLRGALLYAASSVAAELRLEAQTFVKASLAESQRQARRWRRLKRSSVLVLTVLVGALVVQWRRATVEAASALSESARNRDRYIMSQALLLPLHARALAPYLLREVKAPDPTLFRSALARGGPLLTHIFHPPTNSKELIYRVAVSPGGEHVAASYGGIVRSWDVSADGAPLEFKRRSVVQALAFSASGRDLFTGSLDGAVLRYALDEPNSPEQLREPDGDSVTELVASADGDVIVAVFGKKVEVLYRATPHRSRVLSGWDAALDCAALSPDGGEVVLGFGDGMVWRWRIEEDGEPRRLTGHLGRITSIEFTRGGDRFVTSSGDGTARVWSLAPDVPPLVLRGHNAVVSRARFSRDGRRVLTIGEDILPRIWTLGMPDAPVVLNGHSAPTISGDFSPDGARVVTSAADLTARVWQVADGRELAVLGAHESSTMFTTAFLRDARHVMTFADETLRLWDLDPEVQLEGCLLPDERRGYLAEAEDVALAGWRSCELRYGRLQAGTPTDRKDRQFDFSAFVETRER
ncbi:nSTAND1 domain-containing NTPase [Nannocystis punicea]|uniref:TIR domain-containing protein n=1 Tax=Nannocystis punicea TaxID=2995304 RepID=A0ABY7HJ95_9BACT|nr:TIR domain-containing protein [Nannocystis poenicansa]WAS99301.1 TIR domain-containing protein [Nannocystis poenicansa]